MERVNGIGGFFFRSENPGALAQWYRDHLGIDLVPQNEQMRPWTQEAGPTAFAPFPKDTTYWASDRAWKLNLRVGDLDAMIKQLRDKGIQVDVDPEAYPYGRFAKLADPEGNPLELWEPHVSG
jgi:predicted enzyme related to lactoylglutathione lyase